MSQSVSTLASDCHSSEFYMSAVESRPVLTFTITEGARPFTGPPPSSPPVATHEATRPDPGAETRGAPSRKQTLPPSQPTVLSDDADLANGLPPQRKRRGRRERHGSRLSHGLNPAPTAQTHFTRADFRRRDVVDTLGMD